MPRERILITVKTYPTLSKSYGETVCTAGIREDGTWVRIYPVPFRRLDEKEQYSKFDWIDCNLVKSRKDLRPESFNPVDLQQLQPIGHIGTSDNWQERRRLLLQTAKVFTSLSALIDAAKSNTLSLAVFKPTRITNFCWEPEDREWNDAKITAMRNQSQQGDLFNDEHWRLTFQIIPKLPYSFSYQFEDENGKSSKMQIMDWEIGQLYWNCLRAANGEEGIALEKVRMKYMDNFRQHDTHFFLGTTLKYHFMAPNPWVIIGVFPIPYEQQVPLF